ncbi:MAG: CopG family transcriptional regulator [Candidatus Sericytochromatia bacterium]|uniref:CopG family transcriptional regulator n=1 Tax=Candidatus Tanganyikabacteria bacterium TaxID=2961651 RepID=A0A938BMI4_9BACT|nr:CopG family transcriptional regulator [Candidatus Tanganyikabacteria bacterium]
MIRKQIYLDAESERKLKKLAQSRRCSEAEVIRLAIRSLPEPPEGVGAALEALGFRHLEPEDPCDVPDEGERLALHRDLARMPWPHPISLSDAVSEDREDRF